MKPGFKFNYKPTSVYFMARRNAIKKKFLNNFWLKKLKGFFEN